MRKLQNSIRAQIRARFADLFFRKSPKAQQVMSICEKPNRLCDHRICASKRVLQFPLMTLRVSTPDQEGIYQGSKWLKIAVLFDPKELQSLFESLAPFSIFPLTGIGDGTPIPPSQFLAEYGRWIDGLKQGKVPSDRELKRLLACVWVEDPSTLWLQATPRGFLMKIGKPVVQCQAHFFSYSPLDGTFRSMSMGQNSIFWGLQFSFPQVYQDPKTMELRDAPKSPLFRKIQLWTREATRATPFFVDGKRVNATMRLGKQCFSWIGTHPQLVQQNIGIYG